MERNEGVMNWNNIKRLFFQWLDGEFDSAVHIMETDENPYSNRKEIKDNARVTVTGSVLSSP